MRLLYLDPQQLELDPEGIREDAGDIVSLAETIREHGLLQPLGVIALGHERYRVVYGGRRQRAALQLGLERVPCIVLDPNDSDLLIQQLVENVQRQDLNDLEKARSFRRLRDRLNEQGQGSGRMLSEGELDEQVGAAVGLAPRTIRRYLGLLDLPTEIQQLIRDGELTVTQAQHLRRINSTKTQIELAQMIVDEGLSAGEVSSLANYFAANPNLTVDAAMQALAHNLGLRTEATPVNTGSGGPLPKGGQPAAKADDDFWADEPEAAEDGQAGALAAFAAEDENPSKNKARVFRIRSLDQMVDEADRLTRAYHEGDLQKWVQKDEGASFKLRLLLKQLRTLSQAIEALVGETVEVE
ncbi:MAG TPA: ParB/RepB/Spo0J family partition protein [Herpetosiphonaceae bacterium]